MSANRMIYALVMLALLVMIFFVFQQVVLTGSTTRTDPSYSQIEILGGHRGGMNPGLFLSGQSTPTARATEP